MSTQEMSNPPKKLPFSLKEYRNYALVALVFLTAGFFLSLQIIPTLPNAAIRTLIWGQIKEKPFKVQKRAAMKSLEKLKNYAGPITLSDEIFVDQALQAISAPIHQNNDYVSTHIYKNENGEILFGRVRFKSRTPNIASNTSKKEKPRKLMFEVFPIHQKDGSYKIVATYDAKGLFFQEIYGLDKLMMLGNENKPVLIVEGEAVADQTQSTFPDFVVLSSPSGMFVRTDSAKWALLKGRKVIIWPDADRYGYYGAHRIKTIIEQKARTPVTIVDVPETLPLHWDLGSPLQKDFTQADIRNTLNHKLHTLSKPTIGKL